MALRHTAHRRVARGPNPRPPSPRLSARPPNLGLGMTAVRIVIGVVIATIVVVALVPMVALVDLAGGGDGLGLCPQGIGSCETSYFKGPELLAILTVLLFLLLMMLRTAFHVRRLVEIRQLEGALDPAVGGRERFERR